MKNGEVYRTRGVMTALNRILDNNNFVRVHRGITVNLKYVKSIQCNEATLDSVWERVPISRSYKLRFEDAFNRFYDIKDK